MILNSQDISLSLSLSLSDTNRDMCAHGNRHCSHALEDNQFCRVVQRKKDEVKASEQTKKKTKVYLSQI
jgi:hypothetical protein